jgi:hypothetical protein
VIKRPNKGELRGDRYLLASIRMNLVNAKFCLDIY